MGWDRRDEGASDRRSPYFFNILSICEILSSCLIPHRALPPLCILSFCRETRF